VRTRIDLSFEAGRERERLGEEMEAAVYRIVQEGLNNAAGHAEASTVVIEVLEDDEYGEVQIRVEDDGKGFDPDVVTNGFGLSGMRERVELLGGTIAIRSSPGEGAEIEATMPSGRSSEDASGSAQAIG
jgi:signal transduction histidine kinase